MRDEQEDRLKKAAPQAGTQTGAMRELTWDECGIEEKVERLRREFRMARDIQEYTARTAGDAAEIARDHSHGDHGQVLTPVRRHGGHAELAGSGRGFDPLR